MPRMLNSDEEFLEGTSLMEEAGNHDKNKTSICSSTGGAVDSRTVEEIQIRAEEFHDHSIDRSKEWNTSKDILNVESKPSILFKPLIKINQLDTESEFLTADKCSDGIPMPSKVFKCFEICDSDMVQANIDNTDCDNFLGEAILIKTNKENGSNCENLTQTDESVENVTELQDQSSKHPTIVPLKLTNQIVNKSLQIPCYLNRPNTKDESKLTQLNYKDYVESDEYVTEVVKGKICIENSHTTSWTSASNNEVEQSTSIFQPSQNLKVGENLSQVSEDVSDQTTKDIEEFYSKQVACSKLSEVFETSSYESSDYLDSQSQTLAIGYNSSPVLEISNSSMNTSKTVDKHSIIIETSEIRSLVGRPKLKKVQLKDVLDFLDKIIRVIDSLEFMNNYLTKRVAVILKIQISLQELINIVYQNLVKLQFLPSSVILVDNEYTVGKTDFNVKLFGEEIFQNLKSMKKELNKAFREFNAFRKDFRCIVRKMCLIPFEQTLHQEMQTTLDNTIQLSFKARHVFNERKRFEIIADKIASETLGEVSRAKEFEHYINILNGYLS